MKNLFILNDKFILLTVINILYILAVIFSICFSIFSIYSIYDEVIHGDDWYIQMVLVISDLFDIFAILLIKINRFFILSPAFKYLSADFLFQPSLQGYSYAH